MGMPKRKAIDTQISYQALVEEHESLVKRIAHHLMLRLPASVLLDDLLQAGMIGLIEAANNFDESKGASFETYASIRIRGNMLDEVRRGDWIPRSVYRNGRKISEVVREIENKNGRDARDCEVAKALDIPLTAYHHMMEDMSNCKLYAFDDLRDGEEGYDGKSQHPYGSPYEEAKLAYFYQHLEICIENLGGREKEVLILYYNEELNLKEIGDIIGVSESRVSQIHSQALSRLKTRMRGWQTPLN